MIISFLNDTLELINQMKLETFCECILVYLGPCKFLIGGTKILLLHFDQSFNVQKSLLCITEAHLGPIKK